MVWLSRNGELVTPKITLAQIYFELLYLKKHRQTKESVGSHDRFR